MSLGRRCFLYEDDGTLRSISQRILEDLVFGKDSLPQYGGQRLRMLTVYLTLDNKQPTGIARNETQFLQFDSDGGIRQGLVNSAVQARLTYEALQDSTSGGPVIDLSPRIERRNWEQENRWQPTEAELIEIVHVIWPKSAARQFKRPKRITGTRNRRGGISG